MLPSENQVFKKLSIVLFLVFFMLSTSLYSQITEVSYMKIKGDVNEYLQVEQEWKKVHQRRLEQGKIYAWYLVQRHFGGTEAEYDYMTVTVYPTIGSMQNQFPDDLFEGLDQELLDKTGASRDLVKTEIFDTPIILEVMDLPQYLNMQFMKVDQGKDEAYLKVEDEIWKPAHAEIKKMGILTTWSVYRQLYPGAYGGDYNYVVVNGYADRKKVTTGPAEGWEEFMLKIHPDGNIAEMMKQTFESRVLIKNELWELIDSVVPQ